MNKICTTIEQSNKLLSLGLDPSTADMGWNIFVDGTIRLLPIDDWDLNKDDGGNVKFCYAWSLTALLELMPSYLFELERGIDLNVYRNINSKGWHVSYMPNNIIDMQKDKFRQITNGNSPIDAAFEMICWLIEQGYIKVNK